MKKGVISIREVAALAGVSVGSASRVINDHDNVSPDTRARVEKAISALDYRPNHAARTLRSRSSKTIGCMLTDVGNPLYANLYRAIEDRFRADGYMLLLVNSLNDPAREIQTIRLFESRGMDGMIITPGNERLAAVVDAVRAARIPTVLLDRDMKAGRDAILFDHVGGIRTAVTHLLSLGHRRIALVLGRQTHRPARRRIEGYKAAFRSAGLPVPDLILQEPTSVSSAFDDVDRLLAGPAPPTAIIAQGTNILMSAVQAVRARGLTIPRQLSVVSIGDTDFARTHAPPIAAVALPPAVLADRLVRMLQARMAGTAAPAPMRDKIGLVFDPRQSCAPVPGGG